jgi:hypothetical protein
MGGSGWEGSVSLWCSSDLLPVRGCWMGIGVVGWGLHFHDPREGAEGPFLASFCATFDWHGQC